MPALYFRKIKKQHVAAVVYDVAVCDLDSLFFLMTSFLYTRDKQGTLMRGFLIYKKIRFLADAISNKACLFLNNLKCRGVLDHDDATPVNQF